MSSMPSAEKIIQETLRALQNPDDVNSLHARTYDIMVRHRSRYYERRVDEVLDELDLPYKLRIKVKEKLLQPIRVGDKEYSNFMEEVSRRVSQAFQPISGYLAELCVERELEKAGLRKDQHFTRRKERTDFILYHPNVHSYRRRHRIEVKNVALRERAVRGLAFDGDSLFGFFNQVEEFTESTIQILEKKCLQTGGYCYMPPETLKEIPHRTTRFRSNTRFGEDAASFSKTGRMP